MSRYCSDAIAMIEALREALRYYAQGNHNLVEDQSEDARYWGIQGGYHQGKLARETLERFGYWPPKKIT